MKQPTPNSTEGSRQIDMAFDVQLTHGMSPQQLRIPPKPATRST